MFTQCLHKWTAFRSHVRVTFDEKVSGEMSLTGKFDVTFVVVKICASLHCKFTHKLSLHSIVTKTSMFHSVFTQKSTSSKIDFSQRSCAQKTALSQTSEVSKFIPSDNAWSVVLASKAAKSTLYNSTGQQPQQEHLSVDTRLGIGHLGLNGNRHCGQNLPTIVSLGLYPGKFVESQLRGGSGVGGFRQNIYSKIVS